MDHEAKSNESSTQPPPYEPYPSDTKTSNPQAPYPQAPYPQAPYPQASYPQASYPQAPYHQPAYSSPPNVVLTTGGVAVGTPYGQTPLASPPPDYLVWSILNTVFCCFWIGIAAIMKSRQSQAAAMMGNEQAARDASNSAKTYNILSMVLGVVFLGGYIGFLYWYVTIQLY